LGGRIKKIKKDNNKKDRVREKGKRKKKIGR
jgi:hypothetical protein